MYKDNNSDIWTNEWVARGIPTVFSFCLIYDYSQARCTSNISFPAWLFSFFSVVVVMAYLRLPQDSVLVDFDKNVQQPFQEKQSVPHARGARARWCSRLQGHRVFHIPGVFQTAPTLSQVQETAYIRRNYY